MLKNQVVALRPAIDADIEKLYTLICGLAITEGKDIRKLPLTRENLMRFGFGPNPYYFVELAEVEEKVIGYALYFYTFSANQGFPCLHIEDLFVLPDFRQCGIGTQLMQRLASYALERECCRMDWHVFDWNHSAIKFYERLGAVFRKDLFLTRLGKAELKQLACDDA